MRRHLLVVSEKKIKMLKSAFGATKRQVLQVLQTQDAGHWTQDAGRMTLSPPLPYTISSQVS